MRKTDWLKVKRDLNGKAKVIPDGRKKMGCVDMSRGLCPRCMGKGKEVSGKFIEYWGGHKRLKMGIEREILRCLECGFEWAWDRNFKGISKLEAAASPRR